MKLFDINGGNKNSEGFGFGAGGGWIVFLIIAMMFGWGKNGMGANGGNCATTEDLANGFAQNNISINAGNKNFASIALAEGKDTGALIIYSDNNVTLDGVYIPKEIAVLIVTKNNDITIRDSKIENGIIMTKGSKIIIDKSTVYGMIEYGGNNVFDINNNCTFGTFQGQPTAIEVFDDYFGYNG